MSTADRLTFLAPLVVLSIAAIFAYLASVLINYLGPGGIVVAIILSIIVVLFFLVLAVLGSIMAFMTLVHFIDRITRERERRNLERFPTPQQPPRYRRPDHR